jgi:hypothetical protein
MRFFKKRSPARKIPLFQGIIFTFFMRFPPEMSRYEKYRVDFSTKEPNTSLAQDINISFA